MVVQASVQTRVVGIIMYILHPYCFLLKYDYLWWKRHRDVTYLIIPTTLVCVFFCTVIPTSPINFIQLFLTLGACARVTVVVICVCVSVCYRNSCYIPCLYVEDKVPLGFCIVWLLLKMLCSKVLATFADHLCLLCFLTSSRWTKGTAMASLTSV